MTDEERARKKFVEFWKAFKLIDDALERAENEAAEKKILRHAGELDDAFDQACSAFYGSANEYAELLAKVGA